MVGKQVVNIKEISCYIKVCKKKKLGHSVIQLTFTKLRGNTGSNRVESLLKIEQNLADLLFL